MHQLYQFQFHFIRMAQGTRAIDCRMELIADIYYEKNIKTILNRFKKKFNFKKLIQSIIIIQKLYYNLY